MWGIVVMLQILFIIQSFIFLLFDIKSSSWVLW